MHLIKVAAVAILAVQFCFATFDPSHFNFGADWDFIGQGTNDKTSTALGVDYVTIWLNDPEFNTYWHGDMLRFCKSNDKTPVFYAYIIAKSSGLGDCDAGGGLCSQGAAYLQGNFNKVKGIYENYAQKTASTYGTEKPVIWLMEPDYFQYFSGGQSVHLSYQDASNYLNQLMDAVLKYLPNAFFSLDISPWNNDQNTWISCFDMKRFSFMHTSGGRTEAGGDRIRYDNNNNVTWSQVNSASGKCIIADDGYGSGGGTIGHDGTWDDLNNIKNRINNGVTAITQKAPKSDWGPTISNLKSSLSSVTTKCGFEFPAPKFALNITIDGNGTVSKSPNATGYEAGSTVSLTATPSSGYKFLAWKGDVTGTTPTISVSMDKSKNITATFVDIDAKSKFILTITSTGAGVVEAEPKQTEYDSGATVTLKAYTVGGSTFNGWSGAVTGKSQLATLLVTGHATVSASFSGNNISMKDLISNGDFEDGEVDWTFGAYEDADAEGAVEDGKFVVSLNSSGAEDWQIQLMQEDVELEKGVKYVLSFNASAKSATTIKATIGMGEDPFTSYLSKSVSLGPTDEVFEYSFTMKKDPTSSDRLSFDAGKASAGWEIDNVSLTEYIELDPFTAVSRPVRVVSRKNGTFLKATITRYDHSGRVVSKVSGDYAALVRQRGNLRPGSYITVIEAGGIRQVKKTAVTGR